MKNLIFVTILVIFLIILIVLYFSRFNVSLAGSSDNLRSVKESKEFGVFVAEYYCPEGFIRFPDNQKIFIKESWIEHSWAYDNWSKADINCKDCRGIHCLYIVFKDPIDTIFANQKYSFLWGNGSRTFTGEHEDERGLLNQVTIADREYKNDDKLNVFVTIYHRETHSFDTVSSFILRKKK